MSPSWASHAEQVSSALGPGHLAAPAFLLLPRGSSHVAAGPHPATTPRLPTDPLIAGTQVPLSLLSEPAAFPEELPLATGHRRGQKGRPPPCILPCPILCPFIGVPNPALPLGPTAQPAPHLGGKQGHQQSCTAHAPLPLLPPHLPCLTAGLTLDKLAQAPGRVFPLSTAPCSRVNAPKANATSSRML